MSIHKASRLRFPFYQPLTTNPHHPPVLLLILRRRLFLSLSHNFGEELAPLDHNGLVAVENLSHKGIIGDRAIPILDAK